MKVKRFLVLALTVIMVLSMNSIAYADGNASWNAGKGTATVDGVKDDAYAGAQEMKMEAVSDGEYDGSSASSAWALYDSEAIYIFVEVTDIELNDTHKDVWEKDSVEFLLDNKDQLVQAYGVSETWDDTKGIASEVKVLKTDKGYNVEIKAPYATSESGSAKFSLQVNACSGGKRDCTLHTNADLANAWQDNSVLETLVFSADLPQTGVASMGLAFGIGAVLTGAVAVISRKKR